MYRFLALVMIVITLAACGKAKKRCWGCVIVFNDGYVLSYRDSMICDKSQEDITALKKETFDATSMGYKTYRVDHCSKIK